MGMSTGQAASFFRSVEGWPITVTIAGRETIGIRLGPNRSHQGDDCPAWVEEVFVQLSEYFRGSRTGFDLPVRNTDGTPFQKRVWAACREIPYGRITTYSELSRRIGAKGAARAVGQALGHNPLPLIVPCHRVIRADGSLGGYTGGISWKRKLLTLENSDTALWSWGDEKT